MQKVGGYMEQNTKEQKIKELQNKIFEVDKRNENNKMKRNIKMIVLFSAVIFISFIYFDIQESILDYVGDLLVSVILGGVYFFFNTIIFNGFIQANISENKYLESLKKELQDLYNS